MTSCPSELLGYESYWIGLAVAIGFAIRLVKLVPAIRADYLPAIAFALGYGVDFALSRWMCGEAWISAGGSALAGGVAGLIPVGGHEGLLRTARVAGLEKQAEWLLGRADREKERLSPKDGAGLLVILLALFLVGCGGAGLTVQAKVADGIAASANAALPLVAQEYEREGNAVIDASVAAGAPKEQTRAVLARFKERWAPTWMAWVNLKAAHDGWTTVLERGAELATALVVFRDLVAAYCAMVRLWPKEIPALPLAPVRCES